MFELDRLLSSVLSEISQCYSLDKLAKIKSASLGKKSEISKMMADLKNKSPEEKKALGESLNSAKTSIESAIKEREVYISKKNLEKKMQNEYVDVTMPSLSKRFGKLHPISKTTEEIYTILNDMGYSFVAGPDIETDFYNFTALNTPEHHPARTMQDTFYINHEQQESLLLRTQTSSVQIRALEKHGAPLYVFTIGATYRSDSDATHTPMFHQIEGLAVDKDINFAHLKWTLVEFFKRFFAVSDLNIRLRPSYFPFTEPSAEYDMAYETRNGKMVFGKGDRWLEMGGCGMVHPNVLRNGGVDPTKYQGFAFGMGLERLTSLKYGVSDLRQYFEYDKRFEDSYYFDHC